MADKSSIEWTEATWNPTTGCDRTSPGCDNCYALTLANRLKAMGSAKYQRDGDPNTSGPGFRLTLHSNALTIPLGWRQPRLVFVNSMSDLFHPSVPISFIRQVFATISATPRHTYQLLTKRSKRLIEVDKRLTWPPNLWVGVSIETDRYTFRAEHLRSVSAPIRFLSLEPLIGPLPSLDLSGVHWVIVGGESGPAARRIDPDWVRHIRNSCIDEGVPFFFKQWGGRTPKAGGRQLDGVTWNEMPERTNLLNARECGRRRLTDQIQGLGLVHSQTASVGLLT